MNHGVEPASLQSRSFEAPDCSMHATVALIRSASAASLESLAASSGMGTKAMYRMPITMAPANVVKNAVAI
jgi:hypothetical protein